MPSRGLGRALGTQHTTLLGRHDPSRLPRPPPPPKRTVNRSHSLPAIGSRTTGPPRRTPARLPSRSSRATTSVAWRAAPTRTPLPSPVHAKLVRTLESGSAPVTAPSTATLRPRSHPAAVSTL